jgi:hypothetical protein
VVNLVFSIELYLKTLARAHDVALEGHELSTLFDRLPVAAMDAIDLAAAAGTPSCTRPSVRERLEDLKGVFVRGRYVCECEKGPEVKAPESIWVAGPPCSLRPQARSNRCAGRAKRVAGDGRQRGVIYGNFPAFTKHPDRHRRHRANRFTPTIDFIKISPNESILGARFPVRWRLNWGRDSDESIARKDRSRAAIRWSLWREVSTGCVT